MTLEQLNTKVNRQAIEIAYLRNLVSDMLDPRDKEVDEVKKITDAVEDCFGLHRSASMAETRIREVVYARMVSMCILRYKLGWGITRIGFHFKKDHSSVSHALNTISNFLGNDRELRGKFHEACQMSGATEEETDLIIEQLINR